MRFSQVPADAFEQMQLNAGILVDGFNPTTGVIGTIIGATSGGFTFKDTVTYKDFGEDIDNCPKNTKELKKIDSHDVKASGTFATITSALARKLIGASSVNGDMIQPLNDLATSHFSDLWWVGDYSNKNGASKGGFVAIKMLNTLSTGGFSLQTTDKDKGKFAFEFTAHYSIANASSVPYTLYIHDGEAESGEYMMNVTSTAGSTSGKTAITPGTTKTSGQSYVYQTGYNLLLPAEGSVLAGTAWTAWDGSAQITSTTGLDIVLAIIDAEQRAVHAGLTTVTAHE